MVTHHTASLITENACRRSTAGARISRSVVSRIATIDQPRAPSLLSGPSLFSWFHAIRHLAEQNRECSRGGTNSVPHCTQSRISTTDANRIRAWRYRLRCAEFVGVASGQPRPLSGGPPVEAELLALGRERLGPAGRRVLPCFLPAVDRPVEHAVGRCHHLARTPAIPVRLEHPVAVPQVTHLHAEPAPSEQHLRRIPRRVPRSVPPHEVAVAHALLVRTLAERRVGDVTRVQVGQLADLPIEERAALALILRGLAVVPHVVVDDQLTTPFKDVDQRDRALLADQCGRGGYLHHRQLPSGRRYSVALSGMGLLPDQQVVQLGLPGLAVDYHRHGQCRSRRVTRLIRHDRLLRLAIRRPSTYL